MYKYAHNLWNFVGHSNFSPSPPHDIVSDTEEDSARDHVGADFGKLQLLASGP